MNISFEKTGPDFLENTNLRIKVPKFSCIPHNNHKITIDDLLLIYLTNMRYINGVHFHCQESFNNET